MNPRLLIPLTLVAAVVLLSGCTIPGIIAPTGIAAGVIIKEFSPDISEIYAGDSANFHVTVENVGGSDTTGDVTLKFFGLGSDWTTVPQSRDIEGGLTKSQPTYSIPGGQADEIFEVTSPSRAKGKYDASVRVTYGYTTKATGKLKVYNQEYLKSIPREAETIMKSSALESFDVTNAPITVTLAGVARPLIYRGATTSAVVTIQISNKGQGFPYLEETDDRKVEIVSVIIYEDKECATDPTGVKTIPRDGSATVACKFNLDLVEEYTTVPIEINLNYKYYTDATTSINVLEILD